MAVSVSEFGRLPDGTKVNRITLKNAAGTTVSVLDYGATVQALLFNGKDIVLGFDRLEDYFTSDAYIGATVGRVCNRIDGGRFSYAGQSYTLACNEAARHTHLHGGMVGFDKRIWSYTILAEGDEPCVRFSLFSADGEEGYPGNLDVMLTLSLTADNALSFSYWAMADADTPVNLTNHTYFNLNGCDGNNIRSTQMRICAEEFTPVNDRLIPTGAYCPVADTPLDFRSFKPLYEVLDSDHPVVAPVGGVDHNFVLAHGRRPLSEAVCAYSPETGIRLTCSTDLPGVQIYTGNATNEPSGKYGCSWGPYQGFCVETQYFPDSVNQPTFPSVILTAGTEYTAHTVFRFDHVEG